MNFARLRGPGVAAALFIAVYVGLVQPALVYHGNERAMQYDFAQMGLVLVPVAVAAFALLAAAAIAGGDRLRRSSGALLCGMAIAAWVGGTFFTASHGVLDGRSMLALGNARQDWLNAAGYFGAFAVAAYAAWRHPRPAARFLLALAAIGFAQVAYVAVEDRRPWAHAPGPKELGSLSAERNAIVILLDAFQSDIFPAITAREPALAAAFDGFTYFPHAVAHARTTYLSMPSIHSGIAAEDGQHLAARYERDVARDSFMAKLAAAGYDAMLVNPMLHVCPDGNRCLLPELAAYGEGAVLTEYGAMMLNFSLLRVAPAFARPWIYRDGRWIGRAELWKRPQETANAVLDRFGSELNAANPRRAARFLHLFSSHGPVELDAGCRTLDLQPWTRPAVEGQDACALRTLANFLARLRGCGLYDRSAIVVLADHGADLPAPGPVAFHLGASANPLLLVKPLGARGPLAVSPRVVGLVDAGATVCAQLGDCQAKGGLDVFADGPRGPYTYLDYQWEASFFSADQVAIADKYRVSGPPDALASWRRLTHLPLDDVTRLGFDAQDPAAALGVGWGPVERSGRDDGRWALGTAADVYVHVRGAAPATMSLRVVTHEGNPDQRIDVRINDHDVGTIPVSPAPATHSLALADGVLQAGVNRIAFGFREANPPAGTDTRPLAVFFYDLAIDWPEARRR